MNQKPLLHHITIASLLLCAAPLHAALQLAPQQEVKVYDYTLKHHPNVSNKVDSVENLDLDDIPLELKTIFKADKSEDIQQPNLLALVLKHKTEKIYTKYLFASTGLLKNQEAQKKAHIYGYHLVQAYPNHCMLGVLAFLHQAKDYSVHTIVVHKSQPICTKCNLIAMQFFNRRLSSSKKGCHEKPFPNPAPPLACACFHSARFTQQQRRLSTLVDKFPKSQQRKKGVSSNAIYRQDEILIPANGKCLYTTLLLGYLLPAITNPQEYTRRYQQLTGKEYISIPAKKLATYVADISTLQNNFQCQQLVTNFMTHMHFKKGKWGGKEEIQKIADYLHIHIQEYIPNPEHPTARVYSDLTRPESAIEIPSTITIHIVRDNPLREEAPDHPESVKTATHQQHYRLLHDLFKEKTTPYAWNSQAVQPNHDDSEDDGKDDEKDDEKKPPSESPSIVITAYESELLDYHDDILSGAAIISSGSDDETSPEPITTFSTEPLKVKNNIIWQGSTTLNNEEKYCFLTQERLYIFSGKPNDFKAENSERTIELTEYELILPSYKKHHTLDSQQQKRTVKEAFIVHLKKSKQLSKDVIKEFAKWPKEQDMDTDDNDDKKGTNIEDKNLKTSLTFPYKKNAPLIKSLAKIYNSIYFGKDDTTLRINRVSSSDEQNLPSSRKDKIVHIWDKRSGRLLIECTGHTNAVTSVSWSPYGTYVASASHDKTIRIWDGNTGKPLQQCTGHKKAVTSISWSPDEKAFASASRDKTVRIWDPVTGRELRSHSLTAWVKSISWSPDGKKIALASSDKTVHIWNAADGKPLQQCTGHTAWVRSVSWSPNSKCVASASWDKTVRIWNAANGKPLQQCDGHTREASSVSWSPDGTCIASAGNDKTVRIWNAKNGNQLQKLTGHLAWVSSVSWSPDGNYVASAGNDYIVRIWDAANGELVQEYKNPNDINKISNVSWSSDIQKIAWGSKNKNVYIQGANIYAKDQYGNNALHSACTYSGNKAIVIWLLDVCKIGLEAKGKSKKTPFLYAVQKRRLDIAKVLKQRGANVEAKDTHGDNALHLACLSGDIEMTTWLLDVCHINIESKGDYQRTPFFCAGEAQKLGIARLLRKRGANVNAKTSSGNNALHDACLSGAKKMTIWLLDVCEIGIETEGQYQKTPFFCAVSEGQLEIAKLLKKRGADIRAKDRKRKNALKLACKNEEMKKWLSDIYAEKQEKTSALSNDHIESDEEHFEEEEDSSYEAFSTIDTSASREPLTPFGTELLPLMIENSIIWQGSTTLNNEKKYCFLTPEKLYIFSGKPNDFKAENSERTIELTEYELILPSYKKHHTLDSQQQKRTVKEAFIVHLKKSEQLSKDVIKEFAKWPKEQDMDTDDNDDKKEANIEDQNLKTSLTFSCEKNDSLVKNLAKIYNSIYFGKECTTLRISRVSSSEKKKRPLTTDKKSVLIWGFFTIQCTNHTDKVNSVSWSPDGKKLASASKDKSVRIWNSTNGRPLHLCAVHTASVNSVSWSPDGKYLASGSSDKSVLIWNPANGKLFHKHSCKHAINDVSWSPNGKHLALACCDRSKKIYKVLILNANHGTQIQEYAVHSASVKSVSWSPNGKYLASASEDKSVRIWDVDNKKLFKEFAGDRGELNIVSWSHDGKKWADYAGKNSVFIFESNTNKLLQKLTGHTGKVSSVSWSPNGEKLVSASEDKSIRIWNVTTGKQLQKFTGHTEEVSNVSWSPNGEKLASASWDKSVRIWDINGKLLHLCTGHTGEVSSVSWPSNECVTSVSWNGNVRTWSAANGKLLEKFDGHTGEVSSVSWSPDGKQLASASEDKSVRIWDVKTGKQIQRYAHTSWVRSVSWSPNGEYFASASGDIFHEDKSVRIWDVKTGKLLKKITGYPKDMNSVSWSPDGKYLVSSSDDKSVYIYGVSIHADFYGNNALHHACSYSDSLDTITWLLDICKIPIETKREDKKTPFLCAAAAGKMEIAKLLKQRDANINAKDAYGNNALHLACYSGKKTMTTWLLDVCKIGEETKRQHKKTAFLCAVVAGQCSIVELLKERGVNQNAKDEERNNALHLASLLRNKEMAICLLNKCEIERDEIRKDGKTPFLCAAAKGQLEIAKLLKKRGANVHAKDLFGDNALHLACFSGDVEITEWLVDVCKININKEGHYQKTPFLYAVKERKLVIAKLLKKRGATQNAKDAVGNNALHYACLLGDKDMTEWLLKECEIKINEKGQYQRTPFLCAVFEGHLEIAKLLKDRGAAQNAKNASGNNALHIACLSGDENMLNWLLNVCVKIINEEGHYQRTPFLCAVAKGHLKIAKALVKRGADQNAKDVEGNNALHIACLSGDENMANWLLSVCGKIINEEERYKRTPFLCAVTKGHLEIAKALVERGAVHNTKDKNDNNALHYACLLGDENMADWLLDKCKMNINEKGHYQRTPLLCAVEKGHLTIAKTLVKKGADHNTKDKNGNNALDLACICLAGVEMVTWLCEIGEEEKKLPQIAKLLKAASGNRIPTYESGNNALHLACLFSGSKAMVTWLLDVYGIDIETEGFARRTPFLCAAEGGQLAIAKLLTRRWVNIIASDEFGNNALHLACLFSGSTSMVTWLLDECKIGIEAKEEYQKTPFLCAAQGGQLAIAKLLIKRGAAQNAKDKDGNNALHWACLYSGSIDMVTWLLDEEKGCGMKIETKGHHEGTPFLCAAQGGQLAIAKLLKDQGAKINAKDRNGNNALHFACLYSGSVAMVTWLLDVCKIGLESKGLYEKTPFLCAAEGGQLAIAKLLKSLKYKSDEKEEKDEKEENLVNIHATDEDGDNALHYACRSGSVEMVSWLLDVCKIGLESKGEYQKTPFLCAAQGGKLAIAKLLIERGAAQNTKGKNLVNIHATDKDGDNALHYACRSGSVDMVTWLLNAGVDTEAVNTSGDTPLACAERQRKWGIVELLKNVARTKKT